MTKNNPKVGDVVILSGESVSFASEKEVFSDGKTKRNFRMVAYTGQSVGHWGSKMVVDLQGMKIADKTPILINHDPDQIAGLADGFEISNGQLLLKGEIYESEPSGEKALRLSSSGFPWQSSMGFRIDELSRVGEDGEAEINGRKFKGPVYVARSSTLMESSFVPLGRDPDTSAEAFSELSSSVSNIEVNTMEKQPQAASLAELIAEFGARPEFVLDQLGANATIEQARQKWAALQLEEFRSENERLKAENEQLRSTPAITAPAQAQDNASFSPPEPVNPRGHKGVDLVPNTPKDLNRLSRSDAEQVFRNEFEALGRKAGSRRDAWFPDFETYAAMRRAEERGLVKLSSEVEE